MPEKLLHGRPYDIVVGRSGLPLDEVASYRAMFAQMGYTLPEYEGPPLPPVISMAKNFTLAVSQHVAAGRPQATAEEKNRRLDICRSNKCGLATLINENLRCSHPTCGCFLETKAGWAEQHCPLSFW